MFSENMTVAQRAYELRRFPAKSAFVYGFAIISLEHGPEYIRKFLEFIQEFNEPVSDGHLNMIRYLNRVWTNGLMDGSYDICDNDPKMIHDIDTVLARWPNTFRLKDEFEYRGTTLGGLHALNQAFGKTRGLTSEESVIFSTNANVS